MEKGVIKFFAPQKDKRYGFIIPEKGNDVFFHFNEGETLEAGSDEPEFSGEMQKREPVTGDRVVFETSLGHKGWRAVPWGFADEYERVEYEIKSRPEPKMYRVLREYSIPGSTKKYNPDVLWEGSEIENLCRKYPRPADRRMDDLHPSFSCGDFDQAIWFEEKTEKGWVTCEDPRPVIKTRMSRRW